MRKIFLFLSVFLFLMGVAVAEGAEIGINLIEYHPDSNYARIQISNNGERDLTKVTIRIDASNEFPVVELLEKGGIVNSVWSIPPGEHVITINSEEKIKESKKLYFSLSKEELKEKKEEEIKKESELKKIVQKNIEETQREIQQEREKAIALGVIKEGHSKLLIFGIVGLVIGIIILFWLIKRGKNV